jgi:hydroxypyruvate isomerase
MALSDRLSANISILFAEYAFEDRFEPAARAGFKAVECWFPYEVAASRLSSLLNTHGLRMIGINSLPGNTAIGQFGFACTGDVQAFRSSVEQALDYASAIGCPNVHVLSGMGDPTDPATRERYLQQMAWAADRAASHGVTVLIEPLNPVDRQGYFLSTQGQAVELIDTLNRPNLKLMFDIYHVQMTEGRIVERFRQCLPAIGHVQLADIPGRHEPGTGEIRFEFVLHHLEKSGYLARDGQASGWIGCEYKPATRSEDAQSWVGRY